MLRPGSAVHFSLAQITTGVLTVVGFCGTSVWFVRSHIDSVRSDIHKLDTKLDKLLAKVGDVSERLCWVQGRLDPLACQECGRPLGQ